MQTINERLIAIINTRLPTFREGNDMNTISNVSPRRLWTTLAIAALLLATTIVLASAWPAAAQEPPDQLPARPTGLTGRHP